MVKFEKATLSEIGVYREEYFESIYESQELFIELLVADSEVFKIKYANFDAGYFILHPKFGIVEFWLADKQVSNYQTIFSHIIDHYDVEIVLCKSFDPLLLKSCISNYQKHSEMGCLFREFIAENLKDSMEIKFARRRLANLDDIDLLDGFKADLFDSREELEAVIKNSSLFVYEQAGKVLGCGLFQRIVKSRPHFDIGMLVHPDSRRKGIGTAIIRDVAAYCHKNRFVPVCGCAAENIASRKTLEKAGFISRHSIIKFSVKSRP